MYSHTEDMSGKHLKKTVTFSERKQRLRLNGNNEHELSLKIVIKMIFNSKTEAFKDK